MQKHRSHIMDWIRLLEDPPIPDELKNPKKIEAVWNDDGTILTPESWVIPRVFFSIFFD